MASHFVVVSAGATLLAFWRTTISLTNLMCAVDLKSPSTLELSLLPALRSGGSRKDSFSRMTTARDSAHTRTSTQHYLRQTAKQTTFERPLQQQHLPMAMVNASAAAAAATRLLWPLAIDCVYQTAAPFDFPVDPIRFFAITESQPPATSVDRTH